MVEQSAFDSVSGLNGLGRGSAGAEGFAAGEVGAAGREVEPAGDFGGGGGEVEAGGGEEAPFAGAGLVEAQAETIVEPGVGMGFWMLDFRF